MRYHMNMHPLIVGRIIKKGRIMGMFIREVSEFTVMDENNNKIRKSKLVISNDGVDTEIILEGNGKIKVTTSV
jgi:hypothetical protein